MDEFFEFKRWYDFDPTVSLAVELFENAPEKTQIFCADYIIKKANNYGVILNKKRGDFDYIWVRWQDKNEKLFEAMECFKMLDESLKKELSLEIIRMLRQN